MFNETLNSGTGTVVFVFVLFAFRLFLFMLYALRGSFRILPAYLFLDCLIALSHFVGGSLVLAGKTSLIMHTSFGWMFIAFGFFHVLVLIPSWMESSTPKHTGPSYRW